MDIDHAFIMVEEVEQALEDCGRKGVPVASVYSNGFADAGPEGALRQKKLAARARTLGIRILGPNSMGVVDLPGRVALTVNAVLEMDAPPAGTDVALDAYFRDCGILRVDMLETLVEIPPLLAGRKPPALSRPARIAVVTTTGGGAASVVDRLGLHGLELASMDDLTMTSTK